MMSKDHPDLFDTFPHARLTDPLTSHEAIPVNLSLQAFRVLRAYILVPYPLLDHDVGHLVGIPDGHQRCSDLRKAGYIERTGERRRTPSGAAGYTCRITPAGRAYLRAEDGHTPT
jgi:hypothetical protein